MVDRRTRGVLAFRKAPLVFCNRQSSGKERVREGNLNAFRTTGYRVYIEDLSKRWHLVVDRSLALDFLLCA